jgi:two-component system phosphate regulon sensor histidine kinase PhoR
MIHQPRTLLWQLGVGLIAVQAVAMVALGWYAARSFQRYTHERTMAELQRVLPLLANRYLQPVRDGLAETDLDRMVKADGQRSTIRITLIRPDGTVTADSDSDPRSMENHRSRPEVDAALRGAFEPDVRSSATTHEPTTYVAQALMHNGQPIAVIRAALPLRAVSNVPTDVVRAVGAAALGLLALTVAIFYLVSRRLSRSVWRLADGAARFAAGDLSHRIVRPSSQELAALAEALNHMAERLSDQIDLLQAQRNEQQAIHQSMSNGMLALDVEQRIISVNRAAERLLGINGEAVRGRMLQEVLREPELNRFVAESLASGPQAIAEFQLLHGSASRVQVVTEHLRNARDQPVGLLVLMNDVTQLRRLETIRSDFAANVSHELRTPITNIKGYVETMLDVGVRDQAQTRRFLEIINRNTARLASIIEDLLALARLEQPDMRSTLERVDIAVLRVIESALAQFEPDIKAKDMTAVVRVGGPPDLHVHANAQLLEQAISNLVSNAIKYSPAATTIRITAERLDTGDVAIGVADEGPGIPAEHRARIFERFYRVDRARSRELGGTGLGLAIVKHIALVHGGSVTVDSEVGRGSAFRITIPRPR